MSNDNTPDRDLDPPEESIRIESEFERDYETVDALKAEGAA